jgi:serine/threonine-protein kinase
VAPTDVQCPTCLAPLGLEEDLPQAGLVLSNRYELHALVGAGGMGGVYSAWDRELERVIAVKVLPRTLGRARDTVRRFLTEARRASALDHVNVISIYDVGRDGPWLYFVMRLLKGRAIEQMLESGNPLPAKDALHIADQLLAGLAHIHESGLVHRDIKPGNVFLEESGRVVILDFGILRSSTGGPKLTTANRAVGTPAFMAPEVLRGAEADARSDLYAATLVLFEMFTGRPAFDDPVTGSFPQQVTKPPPSLRTSFPSAHPLLVEIVAKGLATDPAKRFQTAREMREAVHAAEREIAGEAVRVGSLPTVETGTVPPPATRRRTAAVAAAVAVAAVVAAVLALGSSQGAGQAAREPETSAPPMAMPPAPQSDAPRKPPAPATVPEIALTVAPEEVAEPASSSPRILRPRSGRPSRTTSAPQTAAPAPAEGGDAFSRARAALAAGRAGEAAALFEEAAEHGRADAYRGLGQAYERIGNRNAAIGAYRQYLRRVPAARDKSAIEARISALVGG